MNAVITPLLRALFMFCSFGVLNAANEGPPDKAKMMEIMRRLGLTPAPPQI